MPWRPLGAIPPRLLSDTRQKLHRSAQWLARIARSYYPSVEDDSHTALAFHPPTGAAGLGAVDGVDGPVVPSFVFAQMALSLDHEPTGLIQPLGGLHDAARTNAVRTALHTVGLDPARLILELPYESEIPVTSDNAPSADYAAELTRYYANIYECLADLSDEDASTSPIRLWPHHFDMARLISLDEEGDPEHRRSIGVGLAPDDGAYDQPYLYIAPWPAAAISTLPPPPTGLRWHQEGFTALVATAEEIMLGPDAEFQIRSVIDEGVALCKELLTEQPR